jgi:class 3 adenylate cyclase/tetratricopeptide (TPR) repeat protein
MKKSVQVKEEIGDKKGIASSLNNIGNIYQDQGNYSRALEYYQKSLAIKEEIADKNGIASSQNNIGIIYANQGNYASALEYFQRSLAIHKEIRDKREIAGSLNNIGNIYEEQGDYPCALEYNQKSLAIKEEIADKNGIASSLINIGLLYKVQNKNSLALDYCQRGLAIYEEIGAKEGIATSLNNIGSLYQKQGKNSLALSYCRRGLELADEIGALERQKTACQCLYNTYKALRKGNEALVYLEKMNMISDSLEAEEINKKLQQMEFAKQVYQDSVETAERERQVQEAHMEEMRKRAQSRNMAFISGFVALLLAGGFFSGWRYVRKSKANLQTEKDRSDSLLLNILPEDIARELKEKGKADAREFEMVSILFTDFKSFTEQSEKLSATELVNEINHCFEAFDGVIEKYGIEKIKTIGDAYMAAGGLPVPTDDAVKNTVLAALEMQGFIVQRHQTKVVRGEAAFEMRVGIHTGPVVAGIVGVKKFQYDIWGDTVNTASRMESASEVGKVNISQATYELLKDDPAFSFESRGKIEAKGKGEMEMLFVSKA